MKYLFLLLLFLPNFAFAAIAEDNAGTFNVASLANSGNGTLVIGAGAHNCVFVGVQDPTSARIVSSVVVAGKTATPVTTSFTSGSFNQDLYYACGVNTGSQTITVNMNNSNTGGAGVDMVSYTGVCQASPIDTFNTASKVSATSPLNTSTTVNKTGDWLVMASNWNVTVAAGTGTTARTASKIIFDSNGTVSTGSQSLQETWSGTGTVGAIIAAFKPDTACGTKFAPWQMSTF